MADPTTTSDGLCAGAHATLSRIGFRPLHDGVGLHHDDSGLLVELTTAARIDVLDDPDTVPETT